MKYLCLVYAEDSGSEDPDVAPPFRTQQCEACAMLDFEGDLARSGHALLFAAISPAATTTLTIGHGSLGIAESDRGEKPLIACYLVQARDLNEAIRVSGRIRGFRIYRIEVHPVLERPVCIID